MYPRSVAASEAVPVEFEYVSPPEATSDFEAPVHKMASPLKVADGQTTGARKVESHAHGLTQEETHQKKAKPAPRNAPGKDRSREAKEKGEDINTRVPEGRRVKIRMRTMSNAGGTKGAGQKDSWSDHSSAFTQRVTMTIPLAGIGGGGGGSGGKNAQSK